MGVRRREPARSRLGHLARFPDGPQATRRPGRSRLSRTRFPQTDAQLHLVGEPQRHPGPQHFSGWLPRPYNIGVFDRSAPLPTGGFINQADGTSWMAMYSLNLMRIALELAKHN